VSLPALPHTTLPRVWSVTNVRTCGVFRHGDLIDADVDQAIKAVLVKGRWPRRRAQIRPTGVPVDAQEPAMVLLSVLVPGTRPRLRSRG